jgi:hypothetical protein
MAQTGPLLLGNQEINEVTTVKMHTLGAIAQTRDGRVYRYAKNGATELAAGATFEKTDTADIAGTLTSAQAKSDAVVTINKTVAEPAKFEDGILAIEKAKHLVSGAAKDGEVTLVDRLVSPAAAGATATLSANQYCGVKAGTAKVIGTAEVKVPANAYFWAFVSL